MTRTLRLSAPRRQRDAAVRLLVAAARESGLDPTSAAGLLRRAPDDVVLALADFHRVAGLAYRRLHALPGIPPSLLGGLRARYDAAVQHHLRILWGLRQVRDALGRVGCRWAVVKGPTVVETLYGGEAGQRPYLDLDILVDPLAFGEVLAELERSDARVVDRNWVQLRRGMRGEVHLELPGRVPLDLHWNLIDMYRGRMDLDTGELLDRRQLVDVAGMSVPSLDVEDTLVHLAFHAAHSGGDRLLWLKDVERAAAVGNPDWESVVDRARRARVSPAVGLILARAHQVLGASVPMDVPDRLLGPRMRRVAALVDRLSPWEYGLGRLAAPTRLFSRSIGHGVVRGTAWVVWRSIRNLDPWQQVRTSTFTPHGSEHDRRSFVQAVAEAGRRRRR